MNNTNTDRKRPLSTSVAAFVLAMLSAAGLAAPLLLDGGVPAAIIYFSVASGVAGLIAVAGLLRLKRWGMVLAIVVSALGILSAAPGLVAAPTSGLLAQAIVGIVGSALVVVLVALPASRRAYA